VWHSTQRKIDLDKKCVRFYPDNSFTFAILQADSIQAVCFYGDERIGRYSEGDPASIFGYDRDEFG
jgi:hypothetical protein